MHQSHVCITNQNFPTCIKFTFYILEVCMMTIFTENMTVTQLKAWKRLYIFYKTTKNINTPTVTVPLYKTWRTRSVRRIVHYDSR